IIGLMISPDGRWLLTQQKGPVEHIRVWDARGWKATGEVIRPDNVWPIAISGDGCRVFAGSRVWDVRTGQPVSPHLEVEDLAHGKVAMSADGRTIVAWGMQVPTTGYIFSEVALIQTPQSDTSCVKEFPLTHSVHEEDRLRKVQTTIRYSECQ